jgi:glutamyl-tRNA synthetase
MIMKALGAEPPIYAHLPLLHGPDGKKLSKRHGAASVQELRDAGYLPEAVRNYVALLGWGYDESTTFFTTEELIEHFSLERVSKSPAVFDEQKLRWMNGRYQRELSVEELHGRLERFHDRELPREAVAIAQEKMQTLAEFWPLAGFLVEPQPTDEKAWKKVMGDGAGERLARARDAIADVEPFEPEALESRLSPLVEELGVKARDLYQPIRVAISGSTISPGIFESVAALGREETLARIDRAIERALPGSGGPTSESG